MIRLVLEIRQGQHLYFKNPCDAEVALKHSDSFPPRGGNSCFQPTVLTVAERLCALVFILFSI